MVQECVELLQAAGSAHGKTFVDATFGAGGHTTALLDRISDSKVLAIDADPESVERARVLARKYPGRLTAAHGNFADVDALLDRAGINYIDGILYDLGISSLQLGSGSRGFSFAGGEPLDMRLDPTSDQPTASQLLATMPQAQLEALLSDFGDERHARAIARAVVRRRARTAGQWTAADLVSAVLSAIPKRQSRRIHPATRTFQALRMAVNGELDNLKRSLQSVVHRLKPRGRIVAISFHSGEDRVVKRQFKEFEHDGLAATLTRKPLRPTAGEVRANVRSRSAKLRAAERRSGINQTSGRSR